MTISELKNQLKFGRPERVYLFCGEENYLISSYIDKLKKLVIAEGTYELNYFEFEGASSLNEVRNACDVAPMFSERKLVLWNNPGIFKKPAGEEKAEDSALELISRIPDYTCLVLIEKEVDKRFKKVLNAVESNGSIVEFPLQKPEDLVKWIASVLSEKGRQIDIKAAYKLLEFSELGMGSIQNELDKLVLYTDGRDRITAEDIDKVTTKSLKSVIFDLTDAVALKKGEDALRILDEMLQQREPAARIMFMLSRQFRQMLEVKLLLQAGTDRKLIAGKLSIHPFTASKLIEQSKKFKLDELKVIVQKCLDADIAVKTGKMDDRMSLELLMAEIILSDY